MTVRKIGIARRGDVVVLQVDNRTTTNDELREISRLTGEFYAKTGVFTMVVSAPHKAVLMPRRPWVGRKPRWMR